jgi:hypothetical protein
MMKIQSVFLHDSSIRSRAFCIKGACGVSGVYGILGEGVACAISRPMRISGVLALFWPLFSLMRVDSTNPGKVNLD